jgi:uncharacterized protein with PQ loop repeat
MTFTDENVSPTMNGFLIIANIINIIYNIPQIVKTYKTKSTKDFSSWFIFMRIIGNTIWVAYAFDVNSIQLIINSLVTVLASVFIGYYKYLELRKEYREKRVLLRNENNLTEPMISSSNEQQQQEQEEDVILDFRKEYMPIPIVATHTPQFDEDMFNELSIYNTANYINYP